MPVVMGRQQQVRKVATTNSATSDEVPIKPSDYVEWGMEQAGGAGLHQVTYLVALGLCWAYGSMVTYNGIFSGQATKQALLDCGSPDATTNSPTNTSCSLPEVSCSMPRTSWDFVDAQETYVATFGLVCTRQTLAPLAQTLFFFGFMFGVIFWGRISDRCGRRVAFFVPLVFQQIGVLGQALAPNYTIFGAMRCLTGFGNGGWGLTSYVWSAEMLGTDLRSVMTWSPNVFWSIGQMLLSWLAFQIPEWRHLVMAIFVLGCSFFSYALCLRESPKWLAATGHMEDANKVLNKIAKRNGRPKIPVYTDGLHSTDDGESTPAPKPSMMQLCDPRLLPRFIVMCIAWFATSMGFYGLSLNAASLPLDIYWANVVSGLTCIPAYLVAGPLIDTSWCGRRGAIAGGFLIGGAGLVLSAIFAGSPTMLVVLYYVSTGAVALCFAVVYVYASELFPTDIRSTAMGLQSLCARLGAMTAPFVSSMGGSNRSFPLLVFAVPCLASGALILLLPETRGAKLPGTIGDLDDIGREASEASSDQDNTDNADEEDATEERE